ncbi:type II toxin-antitoxin system VapC family toxin [Pelomicrobium sp.]|uniref:type II toxin-antitoxin system VapC family toxin n=1 Tax=Pelomicrobium sp. TaxID=2815319 RepID=UPI002FDD125D
MIVADTNLVAYLLWDNPMRKAAEQAYRQDPEWIAPALWRSEFRNILCGLMRRRKLGLAAALAYWWEAEALVRVPDTEPDGETVLGLAHATACTAYDCEFVALAQRLGVPLVTEEAHILRAFPETAIDILRFLG